MYTCCPQKPVHNTACGPLPKKEKKCLDIPALRGSICLHGTQNGDGGLHGSGRVKNSDTHNIVVMRFETGDSTGEVCGNTGGEMEIWRGGGETKQAQKLLFGGGQAGWEGGRFFLLPPSPARSGYILLLKK